MPRLWFFHKLPDGDFTIGADGLSQLGLDIAAMGLAPDARDVRLSSISGLSFRYVESRQAMEIEAADHLVAPVVLDTMMAQRPLDVDRVESHFGAMLNYGLYARARDEGVRVSGQYEARMMTGLGNFTTTGFVDWGSDTIDAFGHVRLDTNWRYVDVRRVLALTVGDAIGDGGQLGSAYRLGGVQLRRDYGNRADIITMAMPVFGGSVAVPSTIDLYVNGLRYFSGETGRGPFEFRNLPNLGGGATATMVVTDAAGRETRISRPIFFAPGVLRKGLLDFSVEAGFPRLRYGIASFDYADDPAASGSVRYGITNWLTGMAHVEGTAGLINGGLGVALALGGFGVLTPGIAASRYKGDGGIRWEVKAQARVRGVNLYGEMQRTGWAYQDIITATAMREGFTGELGGRGSEIGYDEPVYSAYAREIDRLGVSTSLWNTGISVHYTRMRLTRREIKLGAVGVNRTLFRRLSVWVQGYKDFGDNRDYGLFAGFNLMLGRNTLSSNVSNRRETTTLTTRLSNNPGNREGAWAWSLASTEVLNGPVNAYRSADVRYFGRMANYSLGIDNYRGEVSVAAGVEGSIVAMDGLHFSRPIHSGFAIVHGAGADTPIFVDTVRITKANRNATALVTHVDALQSNIVSIDPVNLRVDLIPTRTEVEVIPGDRAGVVVDFGVRPLAAAIIVLVDSKGEKLPLGSFVQLEGGTEKAVVGFDGRVYLTELKASNHIHVQRAREPDCTAEFAFTPVQGQQPVIGPVTCQ